MTLLQGNDQMSHGSYQPLVVRLEQSPIVQYEQMETTNSSTSTHSTCFPSSNSIFANNTVFVVEAVSPTDSNETIAVGNYTAASGGFSAHCNETELPDSMGDLTTQLIEYQYEIAWNRNNSCISKSINTEMNLNPTAQSVEQLLNVYLSQQLLQNCTFRQRYVQFYSISTLPFDQVIDPSVVPCSSTLFPSSNDWNCARIDGSLTVQTFYKSSRKHRLRKLSHSKHIPQPLLHHRRSISRLLNNNIFTATGTTATTFSDPVLAQKMGSMLESFFNTTLPPLYLFHDHTLHMEFVAITNFVSPEIPTWDPPTLTNETAVSGINGESSIQSPVFRGPSISQTWGIVVVTITALAFLLVTLGMIWHKRRQQRQIQCLLMKSRPQAKPSRSLPTPAPPAMAIPEDEHVPPPFHVVGDQDDETIEVMSIRGVWTRDNPMPPIFIAAYTGDEDEVLD